MRRRISLSLILSLVISIVLVLPLLAAEKIIVDNKYIQQHRGHDGIWKKIESKGQIYYYLKKTGGAVKDFLTLNDGKMPRRGYVFIPCSEDYKKKMAGVGHERRKLFSRDEEFIWPLNTVETISSHFGLRWGELHTGVDMPAAKGTPIVAAMDGKVVYAGYAGGHGRTLLVQHRNNFYTRYSHNSAMLVKKGDYVRKGQVIAFVGSTGNSTGNHLHFEIRYNEVPLNPMDFLPQKNHLRKVHLFRKLK